MEKLVKNNPRKEIHTKVKAPIIEAMKKAWEHPTYQFHIPGHTKGRAVFEDFKQLTGQKVLALDTTDEFDNLGTLHPATGPIKEALELAAQAFGAKRTFFLLNGSTVGNLAMALGCTRKGNKVLVNRNCHRSILTGLIISGAEPIWAIPKQVEDWSIWGSISPQDIEETLKNYNDISLVWITKELKRNVKVTEVAYQKDLMDMVNTNLKRVSMVLLVLAALLTFISFALINNTVRLSVFARRFSIHTMKLVGASWAFIRWPFIRRALFEGLLSAVVADGILAGGLYALYMFEPQIALIVDWKVAAVTAGSVLLLGLFITTFCSYLSVNKFLRMKAGDLYKV